MKRSIQTATDITTDLLDKIVCQTSRAGSSVERIAKMANANVSANVIALQMTENSNNGNTYTAEDVEMLTNFYGDCKSNVLVTKKIARALINDQKASKPVPSISNSELFEPQT